MSQTKRNESNILTILTDIYLTALLGAYLLWPGLGGYREMTDQKWRVYFVLTAGYVLLMLLLRAELALIGAIKKPSDEISLRRMLPQLLALIYLLFSLLSAVLSEHPATAFWGSARREGLVTIALYVFGFLLVSLYGRPKRWMLWVFGTALSINCILAIIQFTGRNPLQLYPAGMNYYDADRLYSGEFLGTVGNADVMSALLSLAIPGLAAIMFRARDEGKRFLLSIPLALCLFVLLRSFVAGGILGVTGAVVLSIPVLLDSKKARKYAIIIIAAALVLTLLLVYLFGASMGGFLYEASEVMHGRAEDSFGSGRIYIWRQILPLAAERPLFGGGPDTLGLRTEAAFERYDETLDLLIHSDIDAAHNEYLNILINQGTLALLAYLALLVISAKRWVSDARTSLLKAACGCAVLGYCIQAFFGISSPITTPYLWTVLAFLSTLPEQSGTDNNTKSNNKRTKT